MILTFFAFIVVIGVVVFVHEFGHFAAAKLVGARVEAFSIGFGKLFGVKWGETEYRLGYVPLGGYVKISGMVDEFMEEGGGISGEPWEFQSKNTLQKIFMISAGVIMNFLLGFLIYSGITFFEGQSKISDQAVVGNVSAEYPAGEAGIPSGAMIIRVNDDEVDSWEALSKAIHTRPGEEILLVWTQNGDTTSTALTTKAETIGAGNQKREVGLIGIAPSITHEKVGFGRSFVIGAETTYRILKLSLDSIGMLLSGEASVKELTGPAGIVYLSGETARNGVASFFGFIALISVSIGFLNILPFPVLDGGHIVYILIEAIIRKPIPTKIKLAIQQVGMFLLLLLVVVVTYHDILRFFVK